MFIWHATNVLKLTLCPIKWYNIGLSGLILLKLVFSLPFCHSFNLTIIYEWFLKSRLSKTMMPIKCVTIQQFVLAFCEWLVAIISAPFVRLSFILSHAQHYSRKSGLIHIPSSPLYLLWCSRWKLVFVYLPFERALSLFPNWAYNGGEIEQRLYQIIWGWRLDLCALLCGWTWNLWWMVSCTYT